MSAFSSNGSGGQAARRESEAETQARLDEAGKPVSERVGENGASVASRLVRVRQPEPVDAPPLVLPVRATAVEEGVEAEGRATEAAVRQDVETKRVELEKLRAAALAVFMLMRFLRSQAELVVAEAERERDAFMERMPAWRRWRRSRKPSKLMAWVPWALWLADTTIMARPWGVFGSVPLPYAHSIDSGRVGQLVRAAAVSFALVFTMRFAGRNLRDFADRERLLRERVGNAIDLLVIGTVVAFAVLLAQATAKMQSAAVDVVTGGTGVTVPVSSLTSIVLFMLTASFAFGYFLNEGEIEQAEANETRVTEARATLAKVVAGETEARGEVRSLRAQLTSLTRRERLEVDEQKAHTDVSVSAHKAGNTDIYGVDVAVTPGDTNATSDGANAKPSDAANTETTNASTNAKANGRAKARGRG